MNTNLARKFRENASETETKTRYATHDLSDLAKAFEEEKTWKIRDWEQKDQRRRRWRSESGGLENWPEKADE